MGYTTDFSGSVTIDREVDEETFNLLRGLNTTRRMKRDPKKLAKRLQKTTEEILKLYGKDCQFWVGDTESYGQTVTKDVTDNNAPPEDQPGLWCQWSILDDRKTIVWDGGEKFYEYTNWMIYIIEKILQPRGYIVNGEIYWQGEEPDDSGYIRVKNNIVEELYPLTYYLDSKDHKRVEALVDSYLTEPLKEVADIKIDAELKYRLSVEIKKKKKGR